MLLQNQHLSQKKNPQKNTSPKTAPQAKKKKQQKNTSPKTARQPKKKNNRKTFLQT